MIIGGLQPVTLLDYPQKVAAIVFTSGCNMRCHFCYNFKLVLPELIKDQQSFKEDEVLAFLKRRSQYLDGLVITGGEPTMQADLPEFLRQVKDFGYQVKLDTNGLLPEVLEKLLLEKLIDYIAMDIKGPLDQYEKFCGVKIKPEIIASSVKIVRNSGLPHEFRSTLVKGLHQKNDIIEMAKVIEGADLYYLQNFQADEILSGDISKVSGFTLEELEAMQKSIKGLVKQCLIR